MAPIRAVDDVHLADRQAWKDRVYQFEQAWQSGQPPQIEEFLLPGQAANDPFRRSMLEQLVSIDLEYRWRNRSTAGHPWVLEDYVARFSELGPLKQLSLELIGQEYEARYCGGDCPSHAEYVARFPKQAAELPALLQRIDAELADEGPQQQDQQWVPKAASKSADESLTVPPAVGLGTTLAIINCLRDIRALEMAQLNELSVAQLHDKFADGQALARYTLERDWLTPYQVNLLLQGRGAELVLGPYLLLERLGEGGAGQVFKARHQKMDRLVALKVIRTGPARRSRGGRPLPPRDPGP